jgi:hypothetical protein
LVPETTWYLGFNAGRALKADLPYQSGTPEAEIWISGWEEGAASFLLLPHCKSLHEKELKPSSIMTPVGIEWRQMLRSRYFPDSA